MPFACHIWVFNSKPKSSVWRFYDHLSWSYSTSSTRFV